MIHPRKELYYEAKETLLQGDVVSVRDLSSSDYGTAEEGGNEEGLDSSEDDESGYDDIVPEEELEKVRLLLKGREEILLDIPVDKPK